MRQPLQQQFAEHVKADIALLRMKIHALAWKRQTAEYYQVQNRLPNGKLKYYPLVIWSIQAKNIILWLYLRKEEPHHHRIPEQAAS